MLSKITLSAFPVQAQQALKNAVEEALQQVNPDTAVNIAERTANYFKGFSGSITPSYLKGIMNGINFALSGAVPPLPVDTNGDDTMQQPMQDGSHKTDDATDGSLDAGISDDNGDSSDHIDSSAMADDTPSAVN